MINQSIWYVIVFRLKGNELYESPVIATLLGFILALLTNLIIEYFKNRNELKHYEFMLLKETKDLLESNKKDKAEDIEKFLTKIYTDLRFTRLRLKSMNLIKDSLDNAERAGDHKDEINKINARLQKVSKESAISNIMKQIFKD